MNLLPRAISEHGLDAPGRAKDVESLGEAVVVNEARVNGEDAHEEDKVAPMEEGVPDLAWETQKQLSGGSEPGPEARVTGCLFSKARKPVQRATRPGAHQHHPNTDRTHIMTSRSFYR